VNSEVGSQQQEESSPFRSRSHVNKYSIDYQDKNPGNTLSYLSSGRCVLTWKDLIQGNIEGYRYTLDDAVEAYESLTEFSEYSQPFLV
jgi:hypothetical protein